MPFFAHNPHKSYFIEDYEILTTILSALKWREHNGGIKMITDETGAAYYRSIGIEHIWDLGIHTTLTETADLTHIDPVLFWAAGKLAALRRQYTPCVMLDTDFIVWDSLSTQIRTSELITAHREYINKIIYPDAASFEMVTGYHFPSEWDWSILPCNTAFLYIADEALKTHYTENAFQCMEHIVNGLNNIATMVFVEQRLLGICAAIMGVQINTLLDVDNLDGQTRFTHTWGYKQSLQKEIKERNTFCVRCVKRIIKDFPEEKATLEGIASIVPYIEEVYREKIYETKLCGG
jgi:hypothetical protein